MKFTPAYFLLPIVFALSACLGSNSDGVSESTNNSVAANSVVQNGGRLGPMTIPASAPAGIGCNWFVASNDDKVNIAFPDSAARYWGAIIPVAPGIRVRVDGRYPKARYFSFNIYDPAERSTDAIGDKEIIPLGGAANPFVQPAASGGSYTAYIVSGNSPSQDLSIQRAPNTLYSGVFGSGMQGVPNGGAVLILYRTYLSRTGEFGDGGAGLPLLTVESADGKTQYGGLPTCDEALLPNLGGKLPEAGLNKSVNNLNEPTGLPLDFPTAAYPPKTLVFHGLANAGSDTLQAQLDKPTQGCQFLDAVGACDFRFPVPPSAAVGGSGGFLNNLHNAYTSTAFSRRFGNIALIRAKAPSYRNDLTANAFGSEQLRYWSVCENEFATQRFTACTADESTPTDAEGYFTVVVSDPKDRPKNAITQNGFAWLPWGPYADSLVLYRHMYQNPTFNQSIHNVEQGQDPKQKMGVYYPEPVYCRRQVFESSNDPASVFKLCADDQRKNPSR